MKTLLVLNVRPELEEDMVDYLLGEEGVSGFTSYRVRGHGGSTVFPTSAELSSRYPHQASMDCCQSATSSDASR